ncbi:MAG: hypothetical protein ACI4PQ_04305 [Butyricicoccaceae bacterium]
MKQFLRLVAWDALFFIVLTVGISLSGQVGGTPSYLITILTLAVCGAFLAELNKWGIGVLELIVVGVPALYLALTPVLGALPVSFPLVPSQLAGMPALYHYAGAVAAGFVVFQKI